MVHKLVVDRNVVYHVHHWIYKWMVEKMYLIFAIQCQPTSQQKE